MTTELSSATRKARKEHQCSYCFEKISKGDAYFRSGCVGDGRAYTWKSHLRCDEIANKLKMFDEYVDEGLTGDEFCEIIQNEFHKIQTTEDYIIPSFKEQLDLVCEKHLNSNK